MKKYEVTIMVQQTHIIEAADDQDAHNKVSNMMLHARLEPGAVPPVVHSIIEIPPKEGDFEPAA